MSKQTVAARRTLCPECSEIIPHPGAAHKGCKGRPDFSGRVGELGMYSYETPSWIFWEAVMHGLMDVGFSQKEAEEWLLSKGARWMLDGKVGDQLRALGRKAGKQVAPTLLSLADVREELRRQP